MENFEAAAASYVEAYIAGDDAKMQEVAESVANNPENKSGDLVKVIQLIVDKIKGLEDRTEDQKEADNNEVELLNNTVGVLKLIEDLENSAGEEAKDNTEAVEVTQDVAADTSADTAEVEAESGGYAPAEEGKEEKSEEK